jgi:hypothetical protein
MGRHPMASIGEQLHPEAKEAPSPFEVFCELNPSDVNCRVYYD